MTSDNISKKIQKKILKIKGISSILILKKKKSWDKIKKEKGK